MSQECKSFTKPKVRFSQDDVIKSLEEKTALKANKPRITSVTTISKPIRIVLPDSGANVQSLLPADDTTACFQSQKTQKTIFQETDQSSISHPTEADNQKPLLDHSNVGDHGNAIRKATKFSGVNVQENQINVPPLILSKRDDKKQRKESVIASGKSPVGKKGVVSQSRKVTVAGDGKYKTQSGKENKGPIKGNAQLDKQGQFVNDKLQVKGKVTSVAPLKALCSTVCDRKDCKVSTSTKSICKNQNSKHIPAVMPCHKFKKVVSKAKVSPVKKTVVRDIIGKDIRPYIGPGVVHKRNSDHKHLEAVCVKHDKPGVSSEKLAKPEYNSIMRTINKLNEVKKEKVIPDFEHLPSTYKDLITRKVSTTLDFPFEETVFRNLVDLSIDEKQFSGRIMRTKDPEPRQRDVVPRLSDFFVPESLEEYCISVLVKPRVPEIQNNWNAFRIHEKLSQWKDRMDNEE